MFRTPLQAAFRPALRAGFVVRHGIQVTPKRLHSSAPRSRRGVTTIVVLALLATGSSVAAMSYNKNLPRENIDSIVAKRPKPTVIFVLGGPGSGKGTQCANLVRDYDFVHLSAGDLLRQEQTRAGSQYGSLIADCLKSGQIVPQEVTIGLLRAAIDENAREGRNKFLIDGFPRKMDQAVTFERDVAQGSYTLFFECPEAVMLERLVKRGETSGRTDDNVESIKKRFVTFLETSMPVVEYYDKQGKVLKLRCDEGTAEDVYKTVKKTLQENEVI